MKFDSKLNFKLRKYVNFQVYLLKLTISGTKNRYYNFFDMSSYMVTNKL